MKKLERSTRILFAIIAILILLFIGFVLYVWIMPEPEPTYLGHSDGDLALGEVWNEEGAFQICVTDVIIGDVDETGMRQCEAVIEVTNENVVAHKRSNTMLLYKFAKDSENAYRISHGSYNLEERLAKIETEYAPYNERLSNVMEIWFSVSDNIEVNGVIYDSIEKSNELSEFVVEKGQTATFRYGFRAREHMDVLQMRITVLASKNHGQQYHGSYKVDYDMGE